MTTPADTELATVTTGTQSTRLPNFDRVPTYAPLAKDGTRHWVIPGVGTVQRPHWNQDQQAFTGVLDGQPWSSPWTPDLMWHIASQVPGWCLRSQGEALHTWVQQAPLHHGAVLEVGTAWGLSLTWITWGARQVRADTPVHVIDTFQGVPRGDGFRWKESIRTLFDANTAYAGITPNLTVHAGTSRGIAPGWDTPLAFLYVDAAHSYAAVRHDHRAFEKHLVPGAIVVFDDCTDDFPSIMRYQKELVDDPGYEVVGRNAASVAWRRLP